MVSGRREVCPDNGRSAYWAGLLKSNELNGLSQCVNVQFLKEPSYVTVRNAVKGNGFNGFSQVPPNTPNTHRTRRPEEIMRTFEKIAEKLFLV